MRKTMKFDIQKIASEIEDKCPEIIFAFLHGSAKEGTVKKNSDIDIAIYLHQKADLDSYTKIIDIVEKNIPYAQADIGILNNADPIYRFEALKGKMLFCKDKEKYAEVFSLTCREYEDQIADYERQQKYRKLRISNKPN